MVDIAGWCSKFGGWNQSQCRCIVSHESGGNANAVNQNRGGSLDVGVWQVNTINWNACSGGRAPCNPSTNLGCAIDVWKWGGGSFKLWSTCGVCGACRGESGMNPDWDGTFPEGYDATRPVPLEFQETALNFTQVKVAKKMEWA